MLSARNAWRRWPFAALLSHKVFTLERNRLRFAFGSVEEGSLWEASVQHTAGVEDIARPGVVAEGALYRILCASIPFQVTFLGKVSGYCGPSGILLGIFSLHVTVVKTDAIMLTKQRINSFGIEAGRRGIKMLQWMTISLIDISPVKS